jgi:uncharacterized protein (DUF3820 family)
MTTQTEHRLPFGKHAGQALDTVPSDYLAWCVRTCKLSSGLRLALANKLTRRGLAVPPLPPPPPIPPCWRCGAAAGHQFSWQEDRRGQRRIRIECKRCHRFVTFAPLTSPYVEVADAAASTTPILDVLTQLDDLDVELQSDGSRAWVAAEDWRRVPPDLHALVRQCSHQLARMIGPTAAAGPGGHQ